MGEKEVAESGLPTELQNGQQMVKMGVTRYIKRLQMKREAATVQQIKMQFGLNKRLDYQNMRKRNNFAKCNRKCQKPALNHPGVLRNKTGFRLPAF